jgi:hypothetical protein
MISEKEYEELFPEEDYDSLTYWHAFLLGTLNNIERETKKLYMYAVVALAILACIVDTLKWIYSGNIKSGSFFVRTLRRIVVSHGLIIVLSWIVLRRIDETSWAKSIKSKKAYRLPVAVPDQTMILPPSTLPDKRDVLIAPQMASTYLGSYGRVLEYAHPGNVYWKEVTSTYADGYTKLPSKTLQLHFCKSLIEWVLFDRRFLIQDEERYWSAVDGNSLSSYCHRAIIRRSDPLIDDIFREIDSLDSESIFGLFRGTSMQQKVVPELLDDIELRFMSRVEAPSLSSDILPNHVSSKPKLTKSSPSKKGSPLKLNPQWNLSKYMEGSTFSRSYRDSRSALPPHPSPKEPVMGAWIEEGDMVEVMHECTFNEWYQGQIVAANAHSGDMAVVFVDGDSQDELDPHCIRPFSPYVVGDRVQVTSMGNQRGVIREISTFYNEYTEHQENKLVISLFGSNENETMVTVLDSGVSRYLPDMTDVTFVEGMKVYARARPNHPYAKGVLLEEETPGNWEVMFLHGDASGELWRTVPADNILCAMDCK